MTDFPHRDDATPRVIHWQVYDAPVTLGTQVAACGLRVPENEIAGDPTCPRCKELCDAYNALEVA